MRGRRRRRRKRRVEQVEANCTDRDAGMQETPCARERERERDLTVYHVFIVQGIVEFVDVVDVVA